MTTQMVRVDTTQQMVTIIGNLYDDGKSYTGSDDRTFSDGTSGRKVGLDLDFATNNALRMKITYDGKVGIGTSNPTQTLHVEGHVLAVDGSSGLLFEEVNNAPLVRWCV